MDRLPVPLSSFPWATAGRPETESELLFKWRQQRSALNTFETQTRFSILVTGKPDVKTWASLQAQSHPAWEVIWISEEEPEFATRWVPQGREEAMKLAAGDWIYFLNAGDVLSPVALFLAANEIARRPDLKLVYSHEKTHDGRFFSKAAWSEFNLFHFNCVGAAWWMKRDAWKPLAEQALFLKLDSNNTSLIPFFLLYRGSGPALAQVGEGTKALVEGALSERKIKARVEITDGRIKVHPAFDREKVSAIICFRDKGDWTSECLSHLSQRAEGIDLEVILVDNQSQPAERAKVEEALKKLSLAAHFIEYPHPFNFAAMHNEAVKEAKGKYLLLLNNDVFWMKGNLSEMVAWAQFDWVGTIGMCLRFKHGDIQHGGLRAFFGGSARIARLGHDQNEDELTHQNREVFGNTFAACLVRKDRFAALSGLRPRDLPNGFGDVAFNFECKRRGWHNLFLGHLEGIHLESASRGAVFEYWEECFIEKEYPEMLHALLREDLGFGRVPAADLSIRDFAKDWFLVQVRKNLPWLKPWKELTKQSLRSLGLRGNP